eukprot:5772649-Amphidinium_carterae.1
MVPCRLQIAAQLSVRAMVEHSARAHCLPPPLLGHTMQHVQGSPIDRTDHQLMSSIDSRHKL